MKEAKDNLHVKYLEEIGKVWYTKLYNHAGNMLNKMNFDEENYLKLLPEILEAIKAIYSEVKGKEATLGEIIDDLDKRLKALEELLKKEE